MINTEFNRGGAAKIARTLYQDLNKKEEITCYFAYGRGKRPEEETVYKFTFLPEIYFQGFLTRITGLQGYGSWFSTKRLTDYIHGEKFDLIHLHNIHGYYLNFDFIKFLGKYLSLYPKSFIDSTSFMWKKKKNYILSEWNPVIICPSQWLANRVKESYLKEYQVKVIPNAVDIEVFRSKNKNTIRKKYGIPIGKKIILCLAADLKDERKGIRYFFESLKYITVNNLMVVTVGKVVNYDKIKEINIEIKQMDYINDKNEISDIYNIADIFCISSLDDNFPTTVLEAMACGIPVVGFNIGGIPEQVTEDCGILLNPKDSEVLGRALEKLLNDDELRKKFSENCRKRVLQNYTIEKFTDNYIKIYNKAIRRLNQ